MSIVKTLNWKTASYLFARHLKCRQYECDNLIPRKFFVKCNLECSTELGRPKETFYLGPYVTAKEANEAYMEALRMMKEEESFWKKFARERV